MLSLIKETKHITVECVYIGCTITRIKRERIKLLKLHEASDKIF